MPIPVYDYAYDPTGLEPANLITNEVQVITAVNPEEFHIVVPRYAPFFLDSFVLRNAATMAVLVRGVDYLATHYFKDATIKTAEPIYGSITLLNKSYAGLVTLEYQTVGGRWTLDTTKINEILANKLINPRVTTWEQIASVPEIFPVVDHVHLDQDDMTAMSDVVDKLDMIASAIIATDPGDMSAMIAHLTNTNNPHETTADQVGLGNLPNAISNAINLDSAVTLATSKAVNDLNAALTLAIGSITTGGTGAQVHIGSTPPVDPAAFPLWWNDTNGRLFIYYTDVNSSQWVDASPAVVNYQTYIDVGGVTWFPSRAVVQDGYTPADGQLLQRSAYTDIVGLLGSVPTVTDSAWTTTAANRGSYSYGDGSTTFRMPDYNGKYSTDVALFMRGDGGNVGAVGQIQIDQMLLTSARNTGPTTAYGAQTKVLNNFRNTETQVYSSDDNSSASLQEGLFFTLGNETRPSNVGGVWCVRTKSAGTGLSKINNYVTGKFVSPAYTVTSASTLNITHNLGKTPDTMRYYIKNISGSTKGGVPNGKSIELNAQQHLNSGTTSSGRGFSTSVDDTSIKIAFATDPYFLMFVDQTTHIDYAAVASDWQFYVVAMLAGDIADVTKMLKANIGVAVSDESTALTTGNSKVTFRIPANMDVTAITASLNVAQTAGSIFTIDVKRNGSSMFSSLLRFNNLTKTTLDPLNNAVAAVLNSNGLHLIEDDEITVDITQIGNGTAKGLKIWIKGVYS